MLVSKKGGEPKGIEAEGRGVRWGKSGGEGGGEVLKLRSMNGNRLGNYSAAAALCGRGAGRKCENGRQQNGLKRNLNQLPAPRRRLIRADANAAVAPQLDTSEAS